MKKFLALALSAVMMLSVAACGGNTETEPETNEQVESEQTEGEETEEEAEKPEDEQTEAETPETKPETKPEAKPETKPEAKPEAEKPAPSKPAYDSALKVLETVVGGSELEFPFIGGGADNMVDGAPGAVALSDTNTLVMLGLPEAQVSGLGIKDAASMINAMNSNIFTGAAFNLGAGADVNAFAGTFKEEVLNRQWLCGAPEVVVVIDAGNGFVVTFYGAAEVVESVQSMALANLAGASVIVNEAISF